VSSIVLSERRGRVAVITLNRPEARNALSTELLSELQRSFDEIENDNGVGAVVLTGNGPAFCAGADLKETSRNVTGGDFWTGYSRTNQSLHLHQMLPKYPKPVIAAVNGFAVAGGCGVAMSCDLVVAGTGAQFGYPEVKRGLVAAMVMVRLGRIVGQRQALELLLSGRLVSAEEALALGMINRVVDDSDTLTVAIELGEELASRPASALRFTKELFRQVQEMNYDLALEHARDVNQMIHRVGDAEKGVSAFLNSTKGSNNEQ
jgi:enoyl-CoA hydratase/carnithine racemase